MNVEQQRMLADRAADEPWRIWGPYVAERQWGSVREDYSENGDAWNYVTHDMARSYAYRWGEDGIAGICDADQKLCLSLSLWNGADPIVKERFFGLGNPDGNHGEDVKELYYYLDGIPSSAYLKMLYKYPQREFPYARLVEENRRRGKNEPEFELFDTGIFDEDRYFDIFIEYAKAAPEDILMRVTAWNRGPEPAILHLLPTLWFRNTWKWKPDLPKPNLFASNNGQVTARFADHSRMYCYGDGEPMLLFCENETNVRRLYGVADAVGHFKDGINDFLVANHHEAVHPGLTGTKSALYYAFRIPAGGKQSIRVRLSREPHPDPLSDFDRLVDQRHREADDFYTMVQREMSCPEQKLVQRQAYAGLVWTKMFYAYDVESWLEGDPGLPPPPEKRKQGRNRDWEHLNAANVLAVPDKWEYNWFACWDTAFNVVAMAPIDPEFAKRQLVLLAREWYMHPNGQLPAYEWELGDVNPPVHAWATWRVYQIDRKINNGQADRAFLERVFHKLLMNFTWWVNRKDATGRNLFQGGFLGMDNIGVFDRNIQLPGGGHLNQSDGTGWMAMFSLNMLRIALELALENPIYQDIATKFLEHFLRIAESMTHMGEKGIGLWDPADEFYYDVLSLPDGQVLPLRVRSMVGLIPLFAVDTLEPELLARVPKFTSRLEWLLSQRPDLAKLVSRWDEPGRGERRLLSLLRGHRMKMLLRRLLDESEFLSPYGIRSLSKSHAAEPYRFECRGYTTEVHYLPGESDSGFFGGNSNWRGPIWFPVAYLIIESLQRFHHYYGDEFRVECPTGSNRFHTILEVAEELTRRLVSLFVRDERGWRPFLGNNLKMQTDPHFRDYLLFHEYFDGDTGRGLGANHQTGWTALVSKLLAPRRRVVDLPCPDGEKQLGHEPSAVPNW